MQRRVRIVLIISSALIAAALLVIAALSNSEIFMITEALQIEGFRPIGQNGYGTDIYRNGVRTTDIYVCADPVNPQTGLISMRFSIWHIEKTELDSLYLRFSSANPMQAYLEMPSGYPWSPISFHQDTDGKSVIFKVDDLGFQGSGTVTFDFLLRPGQDQTGFQVKVRYTLHTPAFIQLTQQAVSAQIEIPVER
ncbi:MAG TPA: hypothetical protein VMW36_02630 [Patescibacteria group bacterium]|nr:hypothetical protein [Patescibacteria group bacterium]